MTSWEWLFPIIGYFCGSIPFAFIVTHLVSGIDIRTQGSGNVGATNTLRVLGPKIGFLVLGLDMAKLLVVLLVARFFNVSREIQLLTAALTVAGHIWPIFLRFKGGKGVAVSAALLFYFHPVPGLIALMVFGGTVALTRYVSLGSVLAAITVPTLLFFLNYPVVDVVYTAALAALLIFLHKDNIFRLVRGTENRLSLHRKT